MDQLSQSIAPTNDFKAVTDMKISDTSADALRAFAATAETVIQKNASGATMSDMEYLQAAVENDDASAREHLAALAKSYRDTAVGISMLPVPRDLAVIDLAIVNARMRLGEMYGDFSRVNTDPLAAMLALEQFKPTELAIEQAFTDLARLYTANGVVLENGTPGAAFVNLISNLTARQRAAAINP